MTWREYLHGRGISDDAIERYKVTGDEKKIIIPIDGFNKYRTFPEKNYFYDKGYKASLFGSKCLPERCKWCVLTEGELDALRLASEGIPAVSGTGGAATFKDEWIGKLPSLVFICYDTDKAGKDNALKIHWKIQGSRIIVLPNEYKDITEYMIDYSKEDFLELIKQARTFEKPLPPPMRYKKIITRGETEILRANNYPIDKLLPFRQKKTKCIWHNEKTPSLHLFPNNRVYCFGCRRCGDAIHVYMAVKGVSFRQALIDLR